MDRSQMIRATMMILSFLVVTNCGTKQGSEDPTKKQTGNNTTVAQSELLSANANSSEVTSDSIAESFEVIGDLEQQSGESSLALRANASNERNCVESSDHALVSINQSIEKDSSFAGPLADWMFHRSGSNVTSRKWSQNGAALKCDATGKFAIMPGSMAGLSLEVTFERALDTLTTRTVRASGKQTSSETSYNAVGHRMISGIDQQEDAGAGTIMRSWSIESKVDRCLKKRNLALTVETQEGSPLLVDVTRNAADGRLLEKKLKQGTLIVVRNSDDSECTEASTAAVVERVEISFDNLVVAFDENKDCRAASGSLIASFFKENTLQKKIQVTINDQKELEAKDLDSGELIVDFKAPVCGAFKE